MTTSSSDQAASTLSHKPMSNAVRKSRWRASSRGKARLSGNRASGQWPSRSWQCRRSRPPRAPSTVCMPSATIFRRSRSRSSTRCTPEESWWPSCSPGKSPTGTAGAWCCSRRSALPYSRRSSSWSGGRCRDFSSAACSRVSRLASPLPPPPRSSPTWTQAQGASRRIGPPGEQPADGEGSERPRRSRDERPACACGCRESLWAIPWPWIHGWVAFGREGDEDDGSQQRGQEHDEWKRESVGRAGRRSAPMSAAWGAPALAR